MATLAENITQAISDFDAILSAIVAKGVDVPGGTPTSEYGGKIAEIPSGEWTRPADRPAKPDMQDNTVLMLYGVAELPPNEYALSVETSGSGYTVDWGDGTVNTYSSGEKAEHGYDFTTIDAPVNSDGYKMVWITVRSIDGDITLLDTAQVPERFLRRFDEMVANEFVEYFVENKTVEGWYVAQVFEMYIQCPKMSEYWFGNYSNWWEETVDVEREDEVDGEIEVTVWPISFWRSESRDAQYSFLDIYSLDVNLLERANLLLAECMSLQKIERLRLDSVTEMEAFMASCRVYNQPFPQDATIPIAGDGFMADCFSYNQPFPPGVRFDIIESEFLINSEYNHPLPVDTYRLRGDFRLPKYTLPLPTLYSMGELNVNGMLLYKHGLVFDLLEHGASWFGCSANPLVRDIVLLNVPDILEGISLNYNILLGTATFISIFEALPDRSDTESGWIDIGGCYGAYQLTDDDLMIAVNKNWSVFM